MRAFGTKTEARNWGQNVREIWGPYGFSDKEKAAGAAIGRSTTDGFWLADEREPEPESIVITEAQTRAPVAVTVPQVVAASVELTAEKGPAIGEDVGRYRSAGRYWTAVRNAIPDGVILGKQTKRGRCKFCGQPLQTTNVRGVTGCRYGHFRDLAGDAISCERVGALVGVTAEEYGQREAVGAMLLGQDVD